MASALKVFAVDSSLNGKQVMAVVACSTKKRALELLKCSAYYFKEYGNEGFSDEVEELALAKPETVFVNSSYLGKKFRELSADDKFY